MDEKFSEAVASGLNPTQRLSYYRQLAQDALEKAARTSDERLRAYYVKMASKWHSRSAQMEQDLGLTLLPQKNSKESKDQSRQ